MSEEDPQKPIFSVKKLSFLFPWKYLFLCIFFFVSISGYSQDYLFGLTKYGGTNNKGVPYHITTSGTGFISYEDFNGSNGERPGNGAGLVQLFPVHYASGGTVTGGFVGLTESGGDNLIFGQRIQFHPYKGQLVPPFRFSFSTDVTGTNPGGTFLTATDGLVYALTSANAQYGGGAMFVMQSYFGNGASQLVAFDGPLKGKSPKGSLIQGSDGKLYGMTELGGINDQGVIFSYDLINYNNPFRKLLDFDGLNNGANPTGNLLHASDGKLYGMTKGGGANGNGVIFSIRKDGTGYTKLLDFEESTTGGSPFGSLIQFTDGKLYGMTNSGGTGGYGTLFSITLAGTFTKILDFTGSNGKSPVGDLLIATNGTSMYGVTYSGGVNDKGVLFKLENGTAFSKLYDYNLATGSNPVGKLAMLREEATITFPEIPEKNTLSGSFTPTVQTSAALPVYFTSSDPEVAIIENNQIKIVGAGATVINAFQLGDHRYLPQSATQTLVVKKAPQTITFQTIPSKTFGDAPFNLTATSSSGLPVNFSIYEYEVATNVGSTVTIKKAGKITIRATQSGDLTYGAAPEVIQEFTIDRAPQTINFPPPSPRNCCDFFTLNASSSSDLDVSFKTPNRDILSIYQNHFTILKAGTAEIIAYQPGNVNYLPAEVHASITLRKGFQNIYFSVSNVTRTFGDAPSFIYSLSSSSGLPVTFTSNPSGVAVVEGSYLHFVGVGTTTITATQTGDDSYNAATPVSVSITVGPPAVPATDNIISWANLPVMKIDHEPFNLIASASSGLPVSYTSSNTSVAEISGNQVILKGIGTTLITASQNGNNEIAAATPVQKVLQVEKQSQYISFPSIYNTTYGAEPILLPMVSSEDLPVTYSTSNSAVAVVENYILRFVGSGSVTITAFQSGNEKYLSTQSSQSFTIYPASQFVTFASLPAKTFGDSPFDLVANASSGLPVVFSSSNTSIASISGSTVTIKKAGTVTITARQSGIPGYTSSETSTQLVINKANQIISFSPIASKKFGDAPFAISATSNSGLPVVFISEKPSVAKVSDNIVSITGNGKAHIIATHPGDENYLPAQNVLQQIEIADAGNTYDLVGTTIGGGPNGSGEIYSMNSDGGNFNFLKLFEVQTSGSALSGFIKGTDGRMYGNFYYGGVYNKGRIVRLEGDGTGFTVLHDFSGVDGALPSGNLVQADNGDLYGMTSYGEGLYGPSTIFTIKTDGTNFKVLYKFSGLSGGSPFGGLMQASDGKLYGMTRGGFFGYATLFSIDKDGNNFTVLLPFNDRPPYAMGSFPRGDLREGPDGFLYGSMFEGGEYYNGTLFKVKKDGSGFTKISQFSNTQTMGAKPGSTLLIGSDGKIYGMTQAGGANGLGVIFSVNTDGSGLNKIVDFDGINKGASPAGQLTEGSDGRLYGMTGMGGLNSVGTVFSVNKNGTGFQKLADFDSRAKSPFYGPLVESTPGTFFGITPAGGPGNGGAIFRVTSTGTFSVVKDFPRSESRPNNLVSDPTSEYYYGITSASGIFRMNASGSSYEKIIDFPETVSVSKIFYLSTGHLWGIAAENNVNFLFRIKTDGSEYQRIIDFINSNQTGLGARWLVETPDGYVFGIGPGGNNNSSMAFKIKNDATGFSKIMDFPSGIEISSSEFIQGSNGKFYGATTYSPKLFSFDATGSFSYFFTFPNEAGDVPMKIIETNTGSLGIITRGNGSGGLGSIFTVEKDGSGYSKVYDPDSSDGSSPVYMTQTMDGWFYVAAMMGGTNDRGVVYKVSGDGSSFIKLRDFNGLDGDSPGPILFKKVSQSFTFNALPEKKLSDPAFLPETSSSSGALIKLKSNNLNVAVIENGKIKPVGIGTTTITASLPENSNFFGAPDITRQFVVVKGDQSITFNQLNPVDLLDAPFQLNAVSSAGLTISYQSSNTAVATIAGNTVTIKGKGTSIITASQPGNTDFFPAVSVQQALVVTKSQKDNQTISFNVLPAVKISQATLELNATASSQLPVSYQSSNAAVATIAGSTVTIRGEGTSIITASQPGDTDFFPAASVQQTLVVTKAQKESQIISFNVLAAVQIGQAPFELNATASSQLPVSYQSSNTAVATVAGNTVTIIGVGKTTITASQSGNDNFTAAESIQRELIVTSKPEKKNQTITFGELTTARVGGLPFELSAVATSQLPVIYQSSNESVATIDGSIVTIRGTGNTTITASQSGNDEFLPAESVSRTLVITDKQSQTIAFVSPGTKTIGDAPFQLDATASSDLLVSFTTNSDKIQLNGLQVTLLKEGTVSINANQSGDSDFKPAPAVQISFCINPAQPTISVSGSDSDFMLHSSNATGNQWYQNDLIMPGEKSSTLSITSPGSYRVNTTIDGCTSDMSIAKVFSITALEDDHTITVNLFPNPSEDELTVELKGQFEQPAKLEIIDGMGRIIETRTIDKEGMTLINLNNATAGVYFIKIVIDGKVIHRKIAKR